MLKAKQNKQSNVARIVPRLLGYSLLLCFPAAADPIAPRLPADVTMNKDAGRGNFLFLTLRLENGEALPFVMDTGSSLTVFEKSLESKLGKRLGTDQAHMPGNDQAGRYPAPRLYLERVPLITESNITTLDLKWLSKEAHCGPIMGIVGFDCLKHYCVQLDFSAGKIRFLDSSRLETNKLGKAFPITIPSTDNRPFICHLGLAGGTSTNCQIDTGWSSDGWVEKGPLEGNHWPDCHWDGQTYTNLNVAVGDNENVLGLTFLARHLVTLDFPNKMLYLKQTSVGPLKIENNRPR